ncbi:thiol reductase thioredoxin [Rhizobium leguminosarum]|jgi:thioredoxin-like negative regulator of GroEL|uniref:thioredoxin family protein n=1 Tax=Rhizobium leguminosarum TaxID=384 RepID=UPI00027D8F59|nr:thioredoxin domain-containing protein [Rhizobium leguminosarum]RWY76313.1 thiol reductase thioredoxin [Rhizobium leguminosarum]
MHSVNVSNDNFQLEVQESPLPVILHFWVDGCDLCDMIAQILEEVAVEMKGRIKVAKLDLGKNRELASQFGVQFIPILAFFKGGIVNDFFVDAPQKTAIVKWVHKTLLTSS